MIVVIGGYNGNDVFSNRVLIMDPNRNEWIENTPINIECSSHQSYMIDSKIFIIGGLNENGRIKEVQIGSIMNTLFEYPSFELYPPITTINPSTSILE